MKVGKKVMKLFDDKVEIFKRIEKTLRIVYNVIDIDYGIFGNQTCILIHDTVNINNQYRVILNNAKSNNHIIIQYVDIESSEVVDLIAFDVECQFDDDIYKNYITGICSMLNYYMQCCEYTCGDMYCENVCNILKKYSSNIEHWFDFDSDCKLYMYTVKFNRYVVHLMHVVETDTIEVVFNTYTDSECSSASEVMINQIVFDLHDNSDNSIAQSILLFFNAVKNMSIDDIHKHINDDLVDY